MNYDEWIAKQRRIRIRLIQQSPVIKESRMVNICGRCQEICLCHEEICPNCNSEDVSQGKYDQQKVESGAFIRCRYRFDRLAFNKRG